jgi:hypothetical protein
MNRIRFAFAVAAALFLAAPSADAQARRATIATQSGSPAVQGRKNTLGEADSRVGENSDDNRERGKRGPESEPNRGRRHDNHDGDDNDHDDGDDNNDDQGGQSNGQQGHQGQRGHQGQKGHNGQQDHGQQDHSAQQDHNGQQDHHGKKEHGGQGDHSGQQDHHTRDGHSDSNRANRQGCVDRNKDGICDNQQGPNTSRGAVRVP